MSSNRALVLSEWQQFDVVHWFKSLKSFGKSVSLLYLFHLRLPTNRTDKTCIKTNLSHSYRTLTAQDRDKIASHELSHVNTTVVFWLFLAQRQGAPMFLHLQTLLGRVSGMLWDLLGLS